MCSEIMFFEMNGEIMFFEMNGDMNTFFYDYSIKIFPGYLLFLVCNADI